MYVICLKIIKMYKLKRYAVAVHSRIKGGNNSLSSLTCLWQKEKKKRRRKNLGHVWALQIKLTSTAKERFKNHPKLCILSIHRIYILQ